MSNKIFLESQLHVALNNLATLSQYEAYWVQQTIRGKQNDE